MSPDTIVAAGMIATPFAALAYTGWRKFLHLRSRVEIDAAMADAEARVSAEAWEKRADDNWNEHVLQAVALNESPRPFDSPVKDRIAAQIAANRAQFLDAEWAKWNGEGA